MEDVSERMFVMTECVSKIAEKANLSEMTKMRALALLKTAKETGYTAGKNPTCLAAAALYLACTLEGGDVTQKAVAEAAGVSANTIRIRSKGIQASLGT